MISTNLTRPMLKPCAMSGITSAPLIVAHPACSSPATPCAVSAERMTSPQKGATSSDQSAVRTSAGRCGVRGAGWGVGCSGGVGGGSERRGRQLSGAELNMRCQGR